MNGGTVVWAKGGRMEWIMDRGTCHGNNRSGSKIHRTQLEGGTKGGREGPEGV